MKTGRGKIQKNPRGFAVILPEDRKLDDLFVSPGQAKSLLNGDVVEFVVRHARGRPCAEIKKVVSRSQTNVVGKLDEQRGKWIVVEPKGESYLVENLERHFQRGDWVIGQIDKYPEDNALGKVNIEHSLGKTLTPEFDIPIAIARYNLPDQFSEQALSVAKAGRAHAEALFKNPKGRRDMRRHPFVTIDGADAKDFDDAILVEIPDKGPAFRLYVAIADVSFFVTPGTALDREARKRGTSVYFPGTCIPMLPEILSNDLCSLRPREDKLALIAEIDFNREGKIIDGRFYDAIICTARRLTYDEVHEFLAGKKPEFEDVGEPLRNAHKLFLKLLHQRKDRGVLEFDLPECKMEIGEKGEPLKVYRAPRFESHRLIEEFMIAANQVVAKQLRSQRAPALYRVHESPDPAALEDINALLKQHGVTQRLSNLSPKAIALILEETLQARGAATIHQAILRMQKQARYEPEPKGHFGLALADYTHFTSPIRRYPDLVVHRALKRLIHREKSADGEDEEVASLGELTSERERRAMEAERFVVKRKQCWFLSKRLGQEFNGRVAGLIARGLFVEIPEFAIEGFCPVESLGVFYEHDEARACYRRRPGNETISLGDALSIKVIRVSPEEGEIEFAVVEKPLEKRMEKKPAK